MKLHSPWVTSRNKYITYLVQPLRRGHPFDKSGKAVADVEFGNSLFVAETAECFILDHKLRKEASPGDAECHQRTLSNHAVKERRSALR